MAAIAATGLLVLVAGGLLWSRSAQDPALRPYPRPESATDRDKTSGVVASGKREVAAAPAAAPDAADRRVAVRITVVDGATQQPVADADVTWGEGHAGHASTDAAGSAVVPCAEDSLEVCAQLGGRFGQTWIAADDCLRSRRIVLWADRTVRVLVLDENGSPAADVPVALTTLDDHGGESPLRTMTGAEECTSPDGTLVVRHLQARYGPGDDLARCRARLALPGMEGTFTEFDARSPADPVVVHMPPTGAIELRLTWRGQPIANAQTRLGIATPGHHTAISTECIPATNPRPTDADGSARFERVALGHAWSLDIETGRHLGRYWRREELAGPTAAAPTTRIACDLADDHEVLTGRLLDPDGQPLADTELAEFTTDHDGRFVMHLGQPTPGETVEAMPLVVCRDGAVWRGAIPAHRLVAGLDDLGDVHLVRLARIVAGRFVFDRPTAITSVLYGIEQLDANGTWTPVIGVDQRHGPDAGFAVFGRMPATRCRLRFPSQDHLAREPVEFEPGTQGLVIPIPLGFRPWQTCLLPENLVASTLRFDLVAEDGTAYRCAGTATWLAWPAVPAGTYRVEVRTRGDDTVLATQPDLHIGPEHDLQLPDLDLRTSLRTRTVRITCTDGPHLADPWLLVGLADGTRPLQAHMLRGDRITLPANAPLELLAICKGHVSQRVPSTGDDVALRLAPFPTVTLRGTGIPELPTGFEVRVELDAVREFPAECGDTRFAFPVPALGPPAVSERIGHASASCPIAVPVDDTPRPLHFVLRHGDRSHELIAFQPAAVVAGQGEVTVQFAPDEIRRAIAELQR